MTTPVFMSTLRSTPSRCLPTTTSSFFATKSDRSAKRFKFRFKKAKPFLESSLIPRIVVTFYKQEKLKQRNLKVHEKMTYTTKINFKSKSVIRPDPSDDEEDKSDDEENRTVAVKEDPQFVLAVTRGQYPFSPISQIHTSVKLCAAYVVIVF